MILSPLLAQADNQTLPAFVCFWTKTDKGGF
jgi:hypothetical protein